MADFLHTIGGKIVATISGILLLFSGGAQTTTDTPPNPPQPSTVITQTAPPQSGAAATTTIINRYITQPAPAGTSAPIVVQSSGGVDEATINNKLLILKNDLLSRIAQSSGGGGYTPVYVNSPSGGDYVTRDLFTKQTDAIYRSMALMSRIDQLSGTKLSDITIDGVSGLTDADIPDGITASNYLALTGGTVSGDLVLTGNLTVSGAQTLSGAITIPYLNATSTDTDSTFARLTVSNATTTNATSTNLFSTNASITNFTFTNATGTSATTTNLRTSNFSIGSLTGFLKATAGAVAASLIDLANDVTGILSVSHGGTGWANIQSGAIPYGNGSGALATTTAGTAGQVLALLNGVPTWVATTTLATISGTLPVGSGGTGQTSFGQGWLNSNGTTISASTSPTVNYITATSTTATSTFSTAGFTIGSTRLVVQQGSGNVGIGTASPDTLLTISSGAILNTASGLNYYRNVATYAPGSSPTGTMKITLPKAIGSDAFLNITIKGFNYVANANYGEWQVKIAGRDFSSAWHAYGSEISGNPPFSSIRLADDGTNRVILLGTTATAWASPAVSITDVMVSNTSLTGWGSGWSISVISSETGINNIISTTPTRNGQLNFASIPSAVPASTDSSYNSFYQVSGGQYVRLGAVDGGGGIPTRYSYLQGGFTGSALYYALSLNPLGGNVGIATTSPWRTLSVTGTVGFDGLGAITGTNSSLCLSANKEVVYSSNSDSCASSLRSTKHDIQNLNLDALTIVKSLQPVQFVYNNDNSNTVKYGFIAEDAAAADAHLGTYDANGKLSGIDDRSFIAVLVEALQSLIQQVAGFADNFFSAHITATNADIDTANIRKANVQELCIGSTCLTETQIKTILQQTGQQGAPQSAPSAPPAEPEATTTESASTTPATSESEEQASEPQPDAEASSTEGASESPRQETSDTTAPDANQPQQ